MVRFTRVRGVRGVTRGVILSLVWGDPCPGVLTYVLVSVEVSDVCQSMYSQMFCEGRMVNWFGVPQGFVTGH